MRVGVRSLWIVTGVFMLPLLVLGVDMFRSALWTQPAAGRFGWMLHALVVTPVLISIAPVCWYGIVTRRREPDTGHGAVALALATFLVFSLLMADLIGVARSSESAGLGGVATILIGLVLAACIVVLPFIALPIGAVLVAADKHWSRHDAPAPPAKAA